MKTILFEVKGNKEDPFNPLRGNFVLGDHAVDNNGTRNLEWECASAAEAEEVAKRLKEDIDKCVREAKKQLP